MSEDILTLNQRLEILNQLIKYIEKEVKNKVVLDLLKSEFSTYQSHVDFELKQKDQALAEKDLAIGKMQVEIDLLREQRNVYCGDAYNSKDYAKFIAGDEAEIEAKKESVK